MFNWIWKYFGWHVCEEFTQWKTYTVSYKRPANMEEAIWTDVKTVQFTKSWQERECTVCGKITQRKLEHPRHNQEQSSETPYEP
jgi:hypothetical protein